MLSFAFAGLGLPAAAPCDNPVEALDVVSEGTLVCGAYGDPHIIRSSDSKVYNHMGQGEYQLLSLPSLSSEIHYYGCGIDGAKETAKFPQGTYIGALAMKIGDTSIEIVGNDLSVVGGMSLKVNWEDDAAMGPYAIDAAATTITIVRESITVDDLHKAQYQDKKATSAGKMLYRWSIATSSGLTVHSHAVPLTAAMGDWVLDVHVNYPGSAAANSKGLCLDECETYASANGDCGSSTSCMPINASATYGISPIFSDATAAAMATTCPTTTPDKYCAPKAPTDLDALCANNNVSMDAALTACIHLSGMSDSCYHDACVFDLCMTGTETPSEDWVEEHNPPNDTSCKAVGDPVFTAFSDYKFGFHGDGVYSVLDKESSGKTDPCAVEVQALICAGKDMTYMNAISIVAQGGNSTHEVVLGPGGKCTMDGAECGRGQLGSNQGADGVTLIPYKPTGSAYSDGYPSMGEYGVGLLGLYLYAGGFKVNVTMTEGPGSQNMMNLIAAAPPMCTSGATGLCATTESNADEKLRAYASEYDAQQQKINLKAAARKVAALVAQDRPTLPTYPGLDAADVLPGLKGLSCP